MAMDISSPKPWLWLSVPRSEALHYFSESFLVVTEDSTGHLARNPSQWKSAPCSWHEQLRDETIFWAKEHCISKCVLREKNNWFLVSLVHHTRRRTKEEENKAFIPYPHANLLATNPSPLYCLTLFLLSMQSGIQGEEGRVWGPYRPPPPLPPPLPLS